MNDSLPDNSERAKWINSIYGPNGGLKDYGSAPPDTGFMDAVVDIVTHFPALPTNEQTGKHIIVSVGSNIGAHESYLTTKLPHDQFLVIAGDVSNVGRITNEHMLSYRGQAEAMPLPDGSVSVVVDMLSALWHASEEKRWDVISHLFDEYKTKLAPGGLLIIESETWKYLQQRLLDGPQATHQIPIFFQFPIPNSLRGHTHGYYYMKPKNV